MTTLRPYRRVTPSPSVSNMYVGSCLDCLPKSMTGFSRSVDDQGHVAGDGSNGHIPFSCLKVVVAADDVTSVAEKEMNRRFESSFGLGMSRALQISYMRVC